jgi:uncharacterized protein (TIGR02186 family)
MVRIMKQLVFIVLTWLISCVYLGVIARAGTINLSVAPDHIRVGAFFHGTKLHVTGEIPRCRGVAIKLEGKESEVRLNRKGKVAVIWLNVAQVTAENAPQVYILAASDHLANICSPQERTRLRLGFESLRKRITFESDESLTGLEFEEFVKLKEHLRTYDVDTRIDVGPAGESRQRISAVLPIPSAMPPGEYMVRVYCFERGNLIQDAEVQLLVEKVGLPHVMTTLAYKHPAVYGILAVVIAMTAGLGMGIIFSSRFGGRR